MNYSEFIRNQVSKKKVEQNIKKLRNKKTPRILYPKNLSFKN